MFCKSDYSVRVEMVPTSPEDAGRHCDQTPQVCVDQRSAYSTFHNHTGGRCGQRLNISIFGLCDLASGPYTGVKAVKGTTSVVHAIADFLFSLAGLSDNGTKVFEAVNLFEDVPDDGFGFFLVEGIP